MGTDIININLFGAIEGGEVDNSATIQFGIDRLAEKGGGTLYIPGLYKCASKLTLRKNVNLLGEKDRTTLFIDDTYTGQSDWIINEQAQQVFNESIADNFNISHITFEKRFTKPSDVKTIMRLLNVNNVQIDNCKFVHDTFVGTAVKTESTLLDLFASYKNVTVRNTNFSLTPDTTSGGCVWVRNLATANIPQNRAENVLFEKCTFKKRTHDEIFSVYTVMGDISNVKVDTCKFKVLQSTSRSPFILLMKANLADNILDNVEFVNCEVDVDDVENAVVMYNNGYGTIKNCKVHKSKFYITNAVEKKDTNTFVAFSNKSTDGVEFSDNEVEQRGDIPLTSCISQVETVYKNKINGKYKNFAISGATLAERNSVNGSGIYSCKTIKKNIIRNTNLGIKLQNSDKNAVIEENEIYLNDDPSAMAFYIQNYNNANPEIYAKYTNNYIETINPKSYYFSFETGNVTFENNRFKGEGKIYNPNNSQFKRAQNNDYNGYNDSCATELPAVKGLQSVLPIGHEIRNTAAETPTKWVKTKSGDFIEVNG